MRSAVFLAGTAGVFLAAMTVCNSSQAQQSAPAQASTEQASTAQPAAAEAKPAKVVKTARAATAPGTRTASHVVGQAGGNYQVYLLKGLADIFSSGLDKLELKLRARGIVGKVASHASSDSLADEAIARYRAGMRGPIVIAGHSLGADAAVSMSQRLNAAKVPVALVITFGPLGSFQAMGNVAKAVNYYQANSAWHGQILRGPGFHGSLTNIDLENAADINHFNIEKADRIQAAAVNQIAAAVGRGQQSAPARPAATAGATPETAKPETAAAAPGEKAASGEPSAAKQN